MSSEGKYLIAGWCFWAAGLLFLFTQFTVIAYISLAVSMICFAFSFRPSRRGF